MSKSPALTKFENTLSKILKAYNKTKDLEIYRKAQSAAIEEYKSACSVDREK